MPHFDGGFMGYDFCWSGFSPCSNLGWWGGLKVQSKGFSDKKSLRCAKLMVLWVFCSNLGGVMFVVVGMLEGVS